MKKLLILSILFLNACGFRVPLEKETVILGMHAVDTILVVEETYEHDGTILPAGIYYPDAQYIGGSVGYMRFEKTQVNLGFLAPTLKCVAGVSVNVNDPYKNYKIVAYNCSDPVIGVPTEKILKFKIVRRNSI